MNDKNKLLLGLGLVAALALGRLYYKNHKKEKDVEPQPSSQVTILPVAPKTESKKSVLPEVFESTSYSVNNKTKAIEVKKKKIRNLRIDAPRTLKLTGEVAGNMQSLITQLSRLNAESNKPIYLLINSPGGSVIAGNLFLSAMEASKAPIYTVCTSICASMAFIIHQYGKARLVVDRAILMSHPASLGLGSGELDKFQSFLTTLQRYVDKNNAYIANRAGMDFKEFKARSAVEMWLDAEDAAASNFADGIVSITVLGYLGYDDAEMKSLLAVPEKFKFDLQ